MAINPEGKLEQKFLQLVQQHGGMAVKLVAITAGTPDRLVVFPGNRMYLVELKTETGKLSEIQKHRHLTLKLKFGVHVVTLYGVGGVKAWLDHVVGDQA